MTKEKLREVLIAYTVNLYEKYTPSPLLDMGIVAKDVDDYLSTLPAETEDGGWVRVEDRNPINGQRVIGWSEDYERSELVVWHDGDFAIPNADGNLEYSEFSDSVTHWQPLPSPPTTNNSIHLTK